MLPRRRSSARHGACAPLQVLATAAARLAELYAASKDRTALPTLRSPPPLPPRAPLLPLLSLVTTACIFQSLRLICLRQMA